MVETWGSEPEHFLGEPKKVFVVWLLWTAKLVEEKIFTGKGIYAIRPLRTLILKCDRDSQEKLKPQLATLQKYYDNINTYTHKGMEQVFSEVMAFLHDRYLKETYYARPMRPSKGFTEVPKF